MKLTDKEHSVIAQKLIDRNITWWCAACMYEMDGLTADDFGRESELITDDGKHWWNESFDRKISLGNCIFRKKDKPSLLWLEDDIIAYQFRFDEADGDSYIEMFIRITEMKNRIRVTHIIPHDDDKAQFWIFKYPLVR